MAIRSTVHPNHAVIMMANFSRHTGYAWWLMDKLWSEIGSVANERGLRHYVSYRPVGAQKSPLPTSEDIGDGSLEADLVSWPPLKTLTTLLFLRRQGIRFIYLTDQPFRSWRYAAMRLGGVKRIVVHDHTPGDRPPVNGPRGWLKRATNSLPWYTADLYVAVSPLMRERHLCNARIPPGRTVTVTNGIPVRPLLAGARHQLQLSMNIPLDEFIIAGVGRMSPYKRFDVAVQCLAALRARDGTVNSHLILVGDGPELHHLKSLGESLGVADHVTFTGKVEDAWPILCGVDAAIHPSAGEGFSLAILEMMAAEKPVVAPDLPSVAQAVVPEVTGLLYRDGDLTEATAALARLANDSALRASMGKKARVAVERYYNIEQMLATFRQDVVRPLLDIA